MFLDALLVLGVVLLIEVVSSLKEIVFQKRLIEILDRFLSRSYSDYAASQSALRKEIVEQAQDWEVEADLASLNEASSVLRSEGEAVS